MEFFDTAEQAARSVDASGAWFKVNGFGLATADPMLLKVYNLGLEVFSAWLNVDHAVAFMNTENVGAFVWVCVASTGRARLAYDTETVLLEEKFNRKPEWADELRTDINTGLACKACGRRKTKEQVEMGGLCDLCYTAFSPFDIFA